MKTNWKSSHLEAKKQNGLIRGFVDRTPQKNNKHKIRIPAAAKDRSEEKAWLHWNLLYWCDQRALELKEEYRFYTNRKWRADYAIPAINVLIEYEGLMSDKSGHTTIRGYTKDTEKYNKAQELGLFVIRVTAVNYKTILETLNNLYQKDR